MNSEQLAEAIADLSALAQERVTGIGAEQYDPGDGSPQKFETLPLDELERWTDEELADVVAYATMARVRIRRVFAALRELQA